MVLVRDRQHQSTQKTVYLLSGISPNIWRACSRNYLRRTIETTNSLDFRSDDSIDLPTSPCNNLQQMDNSKSRTHGNFDYKSLNRRPKQQSLATPGHTQTKQQTRPRSTAMENESEATLGRKITGSREEPGTQLAAGQNHGAVEKQTNDAR
jgi:hypothetical protein